MLRFLAMLFLTNATASVAGAVSLTVYTPHGKELLSHCEEAFEAAYPDVEVRWLDMGSQEVLDRIRAEKGQPRADVWFGAPATMFRSAAAEGLLHPYQPSWVESVASDHHDPENLWYGTFLTPEVILYHRDRFADGEAPRTFEQLLEPRFQGRVILREPLASGTMRTILGAMVLNADSEEEGLERLARLDAATVSYAANPTLLFASLARGRGDVTVWNLPDAMLQIEEYGFPFAYHVPDDGAPVLVDAIAIVAGTKHLEHARAFYEFVTSPTLAAQLAHRFYRIPVRSDLDPDTLPEWMRTPIAARTMDWETLQAKGPTWMNEFDREIKGRGRAYLQSRR